MNLPYDYWSGNFVATNVGRIPPQKLDLAGQAGLNFDSTTSAPTERRTPIIFDKAKVTTVGNKDEFSMFESPKIPELFRTKLSISPEIEMRLESNRHLKYVTYSILNLIDKSLNKIEIDYQISAKLEVDKNDSEWEHADITIRFKEDIENFRELWKKIISEVSDFYNSLSKTTLPESEINNLRKFIYILVDTEE
jgi:hypothetical protein